MGVYSLNSEKIVKTLSMKTDIPFSEKKEDPSVIDPEGRITLQFSEDVDMSTVPDGIKLYRIKPDGNKQDVDVKINVDNNSPSVLYINKSESISEGEEYKLSVTSKVKSMNGTSLKEEFTSFFAVDYSFNLELEGIPDLNNERTLIICISDLHLGANDSYAELTQNREALVNFLEHVKNSPNVK